jgi:hypothetical protein
MWLKKKKSRRRSCCSVIRAADIGDFVNEKAKETMVDVSIEMFLVSSKVTK